MPPIGTSPPATGNRTEARIAAALLRDVEEIERLQALATNHNDTIRRLSAEVWDLKARLSTALRKANNQEDLTNENLLTERDYAHLIEENSRYNIQEEERGNEDVEIMQFEQASGICRTSAEGYRRSHYCGG